MNKLTLKVFLTTLIIFSLPLQAQKIVVEDYLGNELALEKPAERIIALAPHIVENLFSAGAGDNIVATVSYTDYPEQAKDIPRIAGYNNFSLEAIISFEPDLVIGWAGGQAGLPNLASQLKSFNIPVYFDEPSELEDVAKSIRDYGALTDNSKKSEKAASEYLSKLDELRKKYTHSQIVSTFYQVWYEPLMTLNSDHIVSDVIRLCGGENIFASEPVKAPKINVESVIARNPDVIVASTVEKDKKEWLDEWVKWPTLTAVKASRIYFIPPDYMHRHTERILIGTEMLCEQLQTVRGSLDT